MPDERGTVRNGLLGDCAWPSKNQASCTFIVMVAFIAGSLYMVPGVGNVIPGDRKFLSGRGGCSPLIGGSWIEQALIQRAQVTFKYNPYRRETLEYSPLGHGPKRGSVCQLRR